MVITYSGQSRDGIRAEGCHTTTSFGHHLPPFPANYFVPNYLSWSFTNSLFLICYSYKPQNILCINYGDVD